MSGVNIILLGSDVEKIVTTVKNMQSQGVADYKIIVVAPIKDSSLLIVNTINMALAVCDLPYTTIVSVDQEYKSNFLSTLLKVIMPDKHFAYSCYTNISTKHDTTQIFNKKFNSTLEFIKNANLIYSCMWNTEFMKNNIGLFNEGINGFEYYDYFVRTFIQAQKNIGFSNSSLTTIYDRKTIDCTFINNIYATYLTIKGKLKNKISVFVSKLGYHGLLKQIPEMATVLNNDVLNVKILVADKKVHNYNSKIGLWTVYLNYFESIVSLLSNIKLDIYCLDDEFKDYVKKFQHQSNVTVSFVNRQVAVPIEATNNNTINKGYYVMAYIRNKLDLFSLKRCIESIIAIDKDCSITVVDDTSPVNFATDVFFKNKVTAVTIVKNIWYPKSGEIFPYWYNTKFRIYDSFIVMHDSMVLKKKIADHYWTKMCTVLWYFDGLHHLNHVTDHILTVCHSMKCGDNVLNKYLNNKHHWIGCFGVSTIMRQDFMDQIFDKYDFENIIKYVDCRAKREMCERLFGIIISLEMGKNVIKKYSLNKCIFDHPNHFDYNNKDSKLSLKDILAVYKNYDSHVIKTWKGR